MQKHIKHVINHLLLPPANSVIKYKRNYKFKTLKKQLRLLPSDELKELIRFNL